MQSLPEAPRPWQLRLLPAPLPPEPEGLAGPSSLRPGPLQPDGLEKDPAGAAEGAQEPEAEAPGGPSSEPGTPRAGRSGMRIGGGSRAERCAGVHISDPYNVNLPLHITSILSVPPNIISNVSLARLTRGLECPALQPRPSPASGPGPPGEDCGTSRHWEKGPELGCEGPVLSSGLGSGCLLPSAASWIPGWGVQQHDQVLWNSWRGPRPPSCR